MFKKLSIAFLTIFLLAACGGPTEEGPIDLTGEWSGGDNVQAFTATITSDNIEVSVLDVLDDPSTAILYWSGSFDPTAAEQTSDGNVAEMNTSVLGSLDVTKDFTYSDGELAFEFTIVGTTNTYKLHRVEE